MNKKLQIVVAVILLAAVFYIIHLIKKRRVEIRYSLIWLLLGFVYLLFDLIPPLQVWFASLLGITSSTSMLVFLAIGIILIILFSHTVAVSRQAKVITRLTQEIGLLNGEIEELKKQEMKK